MEPCFLRAARRAAPTGLHNQKNPLYPAKKSPWHACGPYRFTRSKEPDRKEGSFHGQLTIDRGCCFAAALNIFNESSKNNEFDLYSLFPYNKGIRKICTDRCSLDSVLHLKEAGNHAHYHQRRGCVPAAGKCSSAPDVPARQTFPRPVLTPEEIPGVVRAEMSREPFVSKLQPGMTIAITAGSRGIANVA